MPADPTPPPVPTGFGAAFGAADTADEALLTDAEWDALGRAVVPTWDDETPLTKRIWRGFRMDLALGYRLGLAAGRTAEGNVDRRDALAVAGSEHDRGFAAGVAAGEARGRTAATQEMRAAAKRWRSTDRATYDRMLIVAGAIEKGSDRG